MANTKISEAPNIALGAPDTRFATAENPTSSVTLQGVRNAQLLHPGTSYGLASITTPFLPAEKGDAALIFFNTLTETDTFTASSAVRNNVLAPVFDGMRGMSPNGEVANNGIEFDLSLVEYDLTAGGQIVFEVDREFLCANNPDTGSYGRTPTGNEYFIGGSTTSGSAPAGDFLQGRKTTGDALILQFNTADAQSAGRVHSAGKQAYIRVHITWDATRLKMYANYIKIYDYAWTAWTTPADFMNFLYCGVRSNGVDAVEKNYFRNFQVVGRSENFVAGDKLVIWGDSLATGAEIRFNNDIGGTNQGVSSYDNTAGNIVQGLFRAQYAMELDIVTHSTGGGQISDTTGTTIQENLANVLAESGRFCYYQAGTNDAQNGTAVPSDPVTGTEARLQKNMNDLVGGGYERVFVGTIPTVKYGPGTDDPQFVSQVAEVNGFINSLPAWWDTNNPLDKGRIVVTDNFSFTGGEDPTDDTFNGQANGLGNDVHPAGKGQYAMGANLASLISRNY